MKPAVGRNGSGPSCGGELLCIVGGALDIIHATAKLPEYTFLNTRFEWTQPKLVGTTHLRSRLKSLAADRLLDLDDASDNTTSLHKHRSFL